MRRLVNAKFPDAIGQWLYPPVCLICGLTSQSGLDCCAACHADLPRLENRCLRCALETTRMLELCGRCTKDMPSFDSAWAGFVYRGPIETLVTRFKFQSDLAAGRVLARLLAEQLVKAGAPRPDLMVPVPLHPRRRLTRGFNQAAVVCRDLQGYLQGLPWASLARRKRATRNQSELPAERRRGNVRGAFELTWLPPGTTHVSLVDDVMTTGSTLNECARVLKRAGVRRVDVWVVARA